MEFLLTALTAVLLTLGLWRICAAALYHDTSSLGRKQLRQLARWNQEKESLWDKPFTRAVTSRLCRLVFLDDTSKERLSRQLQRSGMDITPEAYTARSYSLYAATALSVALCVLVQFWMGVLLCGLIGVYLVMRQREALTMRIQKRDEAIAAEMPRFVRTICRTLRNNRDIYAALLSYRKVAGPILGEELDILLAHLRTGGVAVALQQFQQRIGTESAFRLCATLLEIDRGIDQSATLEYLADDMARQSKLNIQKALSLRPGRMRLTYLPAVAVCVAMVIDVLLVFVMNQLNNLY